MIIYCFFTALISSHLIWLLFLFTVSLQDVAEDLDQAVYQQMSGFPQIWDFGNLLMNPD